MQQHRKTGWCIWNFVTGQKIDKCKETQTQRPKQLIELWLCFNSIYTWKQNKHFHSYKWEQVRPLLWWLLLWANKKHMCIEWWLLLVCFSSRFTMVSSWWKHRWCLQGSLSRSDSDWHTGLCSETWSVRGCFFCSCREDRGWGAAITATHSFTPKYNGLDQNASSESHSPAVHKLSSAAVSVGSVSSSISYLKHELEVIQTITDPGGPTQTASCSQQSASKPFQSRMFKNFNKNEQCVIFCLQNGAVVGVVMTMDESNCDVLLFTIYCSQTRISEHQLKRKNLGSHYDW